MKALSPFNLSYDSISHLVSFFQRLFGTSLIQRAHFECEICKGTCDFEPTAITRHLDSEHDLTLKDYYDAYVPNTIMGLVYKKRRLLGLVPSSSEEESEEEDVEDSEEDAFEDANNNDDGKIFGQVDEEKRIEEFLESLPKNSQHCKICESPFESDDAQKHAKEFHGLNALQYKLLFEMDEDKDNGASGYLYKCFECGFITNRHQDFGTHLSAKHAKMMRLEHSRKHHLASNVYFKAYLTCPKCLKSIPHDKRTIQVHECFESHLDFLTALKEELKRLKNEPLKAKAMTKHQGCSLVLIPPKFKWYNGCRYKCDKCDYVTYNRMSIREHFRNNHKDAKFESSTRLMARKAYHRCHLCGHDVQCQMKDVSTHLRKQHQYGLCRYTREFMRHVTSFTCEFCEEKENSKAEDEEKANSSSIVVDVQFTANKAKGPYLAAAFTSRDTEESALYTKGSK